MLSPRPHAHTPIAASVSASNSSCHRLTQWQRCLACAPPRCACRCRVCSVHDRYTSQRLGALLAYEGEPWWQPGVAGRCSLQAKLVRGATPQAGQESSSAEVGTCPPGCHWDGGGAGLPATRNWACTDSPGPACSFACDFCPAWQQRRQQPTSSHMRVTKNPSSASPPNTIPTQVGRELKRRVQQREDDWAQQGDAEHVRWRGLPHLVSSSALRAAVGKGESSYFPFKKEVPKVQPGEEAPMPPQPGRAVCLPPTRLPPCAAILSMFTHVCDVCRRCQVKVLRRFNVDGALCRAGAGRSDVKIPWYTVAPPVIFVVSFSSNMAELCDRLCARRLPAWLLSIKCFIQGVNRGPSSSRASRETSCCTLVGSWHTQSAPQPHPAAISSPAVPFSL